MTSHTDSLEQRLFHEYWDDGLLDVFAAVGLLGIALAWAVDLVALGAILPALLVPLWVAARERIVVPRAGNVEFSDNRVARSRRFLHATAWLGVATLAAGLVTYFGLATRTDDLLRAVIPGLPAALIGLLAVLTGLGLGLPRFYAYAAALVVAGALVAVAGAEPEVAMFAGGAVALANGARLLAQFLRLDVVDPS